MTDKLRELAEAAIEAKKRFIMRGRSIDREAAFAANLAFADALQPEATISILDELDRLRADSAVLQRRLNAVSDAATNPKIHFQLNNAAIDSQIAEGEA